MAIRTEDQGITLRLSPTEQEVRKTFGAHTVSHYRCGWPVQNGAGQWMDKAGPLPKSWQPTTANGRASPPATN